MNTTESNALLLAPDGENQNYIISSLDKRTDVSVRLHAFIARIYRSAKKSCKLSGKRQRSCELAYDVFASRSTLPLDENDFENAFLTTDLDQTLR